MLVISQYTIIHKYNDSFLLYNTFNNSMIAVSQTDEMNYRVIEKCYNNKLEIGKRICFREDEIGDVLSNYFFVQQDTDEYSNVLFKYMIEKYNLQKLHLIMMTNNYCNFMCKYCYENHNNEEMSEELFDEILEAIDNYNPGALKEISIEWFGGEPLLSIKKIVQFTSKLNEYAKKKDINTLYSMTTNGYCLSLNNAKQLFDIGIKSFQITIDGDKELHDSLRPLYNGAGTWDRIMNNLVDIRSINTEYHIVIRVNYTYETLEHIDGLLEFIKTNLNDNRYSIFFYDISDWGGKSKDNPLVVKPDVQEYILTRLLERACEYDITPSRMYSSIERFGGVCYAGLPNHFVLSADKRIRKCTFTEEKNDKYNWTGNIIDGMFVINNQFSKFVLPRSTDDNKCKKCQYFPICMNESCPALFVTNGHTPCSKSFKAIDKLLEIKYRLFKNNTLNPVSFKGYFS